MESKCPCVLHFGDQKDHLSHLFYQAGKSSEYVVSTYDRDVVLFEFVTKGPVHSWKTDALRKALRRSESIKKNDMGEYIFHPISNFDIKLMKIVSSFVDEDTAKKLKKDLDVMRDNMKEESETKASRLPFPDKKGFTNLLRVLIMDYAECDLCYHREDFETEESVTRAIARVERKSNGIPVDEDVTNDRIQILLEQIAKDREDIMDIYDNRFANLPTISLKEENEDLKKMIKSHEVRRSHNEKKIEELHRKILSLELNLRLGSSMYEKLESENKKLESENKKLESETKTQESETKKMKSLLRNAENPSRNARRTQYATNAFQVQMTQLASMPPGILPTPGVSSADNDITGRGPRVNIGNPVSNSVFFTRDAMNYITSIYASSGLAF